MRMVMVGPRPESVLSTGGSALQAQMLCILAVVAVAPWVAQGVVVGQFASTPPVGVALTCRFCSAAPCGSRRSSRAHADTPALRRPIMCARCAKSILTAMVVALTLYRGAGGSVALARHDDIAGVVACSAPICWPVRSCRRLVRMRTGFLL